MGGGHPDAAALVGSRRCAGRRVLPPAFEPGAARGYSRGAGPPPGPRLGRADVFRRALEQASDLVVIADSRGTIDYVNQAVERATGRRREEIVGRAVGSWFPAEDRKVLRESWEAARAGRPYRALAPVRKADGDVIQADIS